MPEALKDLVLGTILPPIIDLVNAKITDSRVKLVVAVVISIVVATAFNLNELKYETPYAFLGSVLTVVATAQAVYMKLYEDSRLQSAVVKTVNKMI